MRRKHRRLRAAKAAGIGKPAALLCWAVLAAGCAAAPPAPPPKPAPPAEAPAPIPELEASDWSRTPNAVIREPRPGERLVWAGSIERMKYKQVGDMIEFEWIFRHLALRGVPATAVRERPIPVERTGDGYFAVRYRDPMPLAKAKYIAEDLQIHSPQFVLLGGIFDSVTELDGKQLVMLKEPYLETGPEMVAFPH